MADLITIVLPHGEADAARTKLAPRLSSLRGKKVGFLDNDMWRSMHILVDEMGKVLGAEYGVASVETVFMDPLKGSLPQRYIDQLHQLSERVDAVIAGLGN